MDRKRWLPMITLLSGLIAVCLSLPLPMLPSQAISRPSADIDKVFADLDNSRLSRLCSGRFSP
jgi:hypothetical protein